MSAYDSPSTSITSPVATAEAPVRSRSPDPNATALQSGAHDGQEEQERDPVLRVRALCGQENSESQRHDRPGDSRLVHQRLVEIAGSRGVAQEQATQHRERGGSNRELLRRHGTRVPPELEHRDADERECGDRGPRAPLGHVQEAGGEHGQIGEEGQRPVHAGREQHRRRQATAQSDERRELGPESDCDHGCHKRHDRHADKGGGEREQLVQAMAGKERRIEDDDASTRTAH